MPKEFHQVKIRLSAAGLGSVEVDGVDISVNVTSIFIVARVGEPNKVTIGLLGGVDLVAEGCDVTKERV